MLKELVALAGGEVMAAGRRKASLAGLWGLAGLFALAAAAYALDGLHVVLAAAHGAATASFMIAGGLLAVALCVGFAALIVKWRRPPPHPLAAVALIAAPAALQLLATPNGRRAGAGALVAALAAALVRREVA